MCFQSKEQSILSRETIQHAFFQNYVPFFDLDFLSSFKHLTAERLHPHAVLLFFFFFLYISIIIITIIIISIINPTNVPQPAS